MLPAWIGFVKTIWALVIAALFLPYCLVILAVLVGCDILDSHHINPFISVPKKALWLVIYPFHNPVRDLIVKLGWKKPTRQPYRVGHLSSGVELFRAFLEQRGFEWTSIAWKDKGEILSMRKIEGRIYQHHVRVFEDGEVRGHYEYTPESHMIQHLFSRGMVPSLVLEGLYAAYEGSA